MKNIDKILIVSILGFISCTDSVDLKYENLLSKIDYWQKTTKYDYPIFDYMKAVDSISNGLINDLPNIDLEKIKKFESFASARNVDDSTNRIIRNYLKFKIEDSNKHFIADRIKQARISYASSLLKYLTKVETDSTFSSLIIHYYLTSDSNSIYSNFDVYIPTSLSFSMINPLNNCEWANLGHGGISVRFQDHQKQDTIGLKLKWYDSKFNDTIDKVVLLKK